MTQSKSGTARESIPGLPDVNAGALRHLRIRPRGARRQQRTSRPHNQDRSNTPHRHRPHPPKHTVRAARLRQAQPRPWPSGSRRPHPPGRVRGGNSESYHALPIVIGHTCWYE